MQSILGACGVNRREILCLRSFVCILLCVPVSAVIAEQNGAVSTLANHGIEPTADSIHAYLISLVKDGDGRAQYSEWIRQLGDSSFWQREAATQSLLQARVAHIDLLEKATSSKDREVLFRANLILEQLRKHPPDKRREEVLRAAFTVITERRIKNLADSLLAVIPICGEPIVRRLGVEALRVTAQKEDLDALRAVLIARMPTLRIAALAALEQLLGDNVVSDAANLLDDPSDEVCMAAAHTLANLGDRRSLSTLGHLLGSEASIVRSRAAHTLRQLSGQTFGFAAQDNQDARKTSMEKWLAWITDNGRTAKLMFPVKDFTVDTRGLVLHFSFSKSDNPAVDQSGCDNHGALHNARHVETGHVGGGCYLDGRGDFVRVANSNNLEIRDKLTLAVWVKLDSFAPGGYGNEEGHIIKKGDPLWWNPSYGLGFRKGSGRAKFVIGHPKSPVSRGGADLYSETTLKTGQWHHLAGTYDGKSAKLYIDGRLDLERKYEGTIRSDRAPLMIGGGKLFSKTDFANHFAITGTVDDIRIYHRVLTADEIGLLFQE